MRILISGASGFVGQSLVQFLRSQNYKVVALKRETLSNEKELDRLVSSSEIVINLNGANIARKWSEEYKKVLYSSRIESTKSLVDAIKRVEQKPKLFISTSAVGIYASGMVCDENGVFASDFLSNLCQKWEAEADKAKSELTKVAIFRLGVVLAKNGGAFKKMMTPFKLGLGGAIGSGKQAFSYIHIEDLLSAYLFVIRGLFDGVFNLTAPAPTTNLEFTKALGKILKRPTIFNIPEPVLKLIFGEGSTILLDGQSAVPRGLLDLGFEFKYKNLENTLENLVK
jgi:uncharacterized protein (TIGR01777 family)